MQKSEESLRIKLTVNYPIDFFSYFGRVYEPLFLEYFDLSYFEQKCCLLTQVSRVFCSQGMHST